MAGTTTITLARIRIALAATLAAGDASAPAVISPLVGTTITGVIPTIGTAAGNINWIFCVEGMVTAGTPVTYDVTSGLLDPDGNVLPTPARIQAYGIENLSTTTGQVLTLAGGTSNPLFSDSVTVQPNLAGGPVGGVMASWNPDPGFVVSGGAKTVKVSVATGTNVNFNIALFGCTV